MSAQEPTISIVTPSYNQAAFLDEAMQSVLTQDYRRIEYVVMDGGSTDGSVDIIRRHADRLTHWISEPDGGQYAALNAGFARTTGEIMGWLNGDDKYTPWAFQVVADIFATFPQVEWITTLCPLFWDARGRAVKCSTAEGFNRRGFYRGENLPGGPWYATNFIQQESTFWRRSLWERAGGYLDDTLELAADFELWARFYRHADLCSVKTPIGGFRFHRAQQTAPRMEQYLDEAQQVLARYGSRPHAPFGSSARAKLRAWLPGPLRRWARRLPADSSISVCVHDNRRAEWQLATL